MPGFLTGATRKSPNMNKRLNVKSKEKEINLFHIILILIGIILNSTFSSATIKIILDFKKRFFNFFQKKNYEHNLSGYG